MNGYKKTAIIVDNLIVDDYIKVAGVLYRVESIEKIGTAYIIQFHNARRPILKGVLTLEQNTLTHIWNQK